MMLLQIRRGPRGYGPEGRARLQFRGANVDPGWRPGVLPRLKGGLIAGLPTGGNRGMVDAL